MGKGKNGDGDAWMRGSMAEMAMGTDRRNEVKEADMEGGDGAMQARESGD
jgi:hypothetical protein